MKIVLLIILAFVGIECNIAENNYQNAIHPKDLSITEKSTRIINGNPAAVNQFPWQVSIRAYTNTGTGSVCGGSVISNQWVLTAAHCVDGFIRFTLGFGSINLVSETYQMESTYFIKHPGYNDQTYNNDVALIQTPTAIPLGSSIQIVRLPTLSQANTTFLGSTVTISGWGRTSDGGTATNTLNYVNLLVISNAVCSDIFGTTVIVSTTICATGPTGNPNAGACQGDSGGPLVLNESGIYTQIGVLSFVSARGCATTDPSGFARTASYLSWISAQTGVIIRP